jgi:2-polyprenyl-3-methyl-5-hydroxy-6-metoxy-1,4-benzoquinol methylase
MRDRSPSAHVRRLQGSQRQAVGAPECTDLPTNVRLAASIGGVPNGASDTGPAGVAPRCSVTVVAVNEEQAEDWNGASGRHFIEQRERHERMLGRLKARLLPAAQIQDGENVLDIGCGCGDTTILAARASPSGHALGADFSRIQVAEARRLAACAGIRNVRFEVADVQVHPFGAGVFDVVLSTFGVMFFDDPAAAFGNVRMALRRGVPMLAHPR